MKVGPKVIKGSGRGVASGREIRHQFAWSRERCLALCAGERYRHVVGLTQSTSRRKVDAYAVVLIAVELGIRIKFGIEQ